MIQVLNEPGKKATTESFMWLYRTDERPIILFYYQATRGGFHAAEYLMGFSGYLRTDSYVGYEKIQNITRCGVG